MNHRRASDFRVRQPRCASWVEVDLGAVRHNVRVLCDLIGPACSVWAVVKANGYGHGAVPVASAALEGGAAGLAVASLGEAVELRRAGFDAPILLLSAGDPRAASRTVRHHITQTVCSAEMAKALSRAALRLGQTADVHLKIDTGLGRLGVLPEEAAGLASLVASTPGLRLGGVFSHLATAEAADTSYAEEQFRRFSSAVGAMADLGLSPGIRHMANSAAALRFPSMRLDRVRTGLLVYGITPDAPGLAPLDVRPALVWKTRLAFTKDLPAGSAISYGCTHVTQRGCRVAVLPLGYADGYPRRGSNRAQVLVRGQLCPVIGRVCMDHVIIDASPAGDARPGDEAVLIGPQGTNAITANQLAQWAETCVHEVITVIGPRVARVYVDGPDVHSDASAR